MILHYDVQYKLTSSSTWSTFVNASDTARAVTITGLTNNSEYQFRINAINSNADFVNATGIASNVVSATPEVPVVPPTSARLDPAVVL